MRVVFDVNLLIRPALGSTFIAGLLERMSDNRATVLCCDALGEELERTASKPRVLKRLNWPAYREVERMLAHYAMAIKLAEPYPTCRDPKDSYLLVMARDGAADFLVTNDDDLLSIGQIEKCEIVTPEEFARRLAVV